MFGNCCKDSKGRKKKEGEKKNPKEESGDRKAGSERIKKSGTGLEWVKGTNGTGEGDGIRN
jgi:hypothetical protein